MLYTAYVTSTASIITHAYRPAGGHFDLFRPIICCIVLYSDGFDAVTCTVAAVMQVNVKLLNYVGGRWLQGRGDGEPLFDPVRGSELVSASSEGIDYATALSHARDVGGHQLRALTYAHRAALLGRIADVLAANRESYYAIALENSGSPKSDAATDIDGAIYTLRFYAKEGARLGETRLLREGELARLGKDESFQALHVGVPLRGVAVLINAFNFPAWGLWEKAAPALLSGVPVFAKPATATAWLAQKMVTDVIEAAILPEGALSIVCGRAGDLLDHVTGADAIAFTGSAGTAERIRSHPAVARHSARTNIEADSLNIALLGPDAKTGDAEIELLVSEVVREMTLKAGQRCTAIRRILVPAALQHSVAEALHGRLSRIRVGNPRSADVQMGPVVNKAQQKAVQDGIDCLARESTVIFGRSADFRPIDADAGVAAFVQPTLFANDEPLAAHATHDVEVFGPVATLLPYRDFDEALAIARLGKGSLVASVFSSDPTVIANAALELASSHGRVHIVSAEVARTQTGHGNVMPMSVHGGPGRAGGGQELGGLRALRFYHQLTGLQGPAQALRALAAHSADFRP
jgi:3,4-dehydroadipyl-CoA semialdehyde dehydrogenase